MSQCTPTQHDNKKIFIHIYLHSLSFLKGIDDNKGTKTLRQYLSNYSKVP
jgi:hypothetical protein